ncbi:MAG: hypothetical protein JSS12_11360, partial [Verrucomicrobia bacterium]|nr:hypothetical protein [Verrucomicrobiota bacterium]
IIFGRSIKKWARYRYALAGKNDKVLGFLLNFGALGVVLNNAQGEQSGLVVTLAPIIDIARKVFANIDNVDALLTPSVEEIAAFEAATKKTHANDKKEFAYWLLARRALDIVSDDQWKKAVPIVKKEAAATLLMKLYETAHATQAVLKNKSASGANEVQKQKDLTQFVDTYFVKNIQELLVQLGGASEPLAKTLPVILDTLIKQSLAEPGVIGEARNSALEQVIYTVMGKLLTDAKTPVEKVREIVACYNEGNNEAVARMLLKEALPEELAATPLGRVLVNEAAPIAIGILLNDIRASQKVIQQKGEEAKSYVNRIDEYSMKPFVEGMLQALDGTLDEMAHDPKKLSEMLPDYMDGLIKGVFKDSALMPIIKEASHTAIYIVLQQVLTPKEGQSIQDRVAEVAAELIAIYDSNNPKESAAKWLKLLLPEATLKALLPEFLKKSITHEKLVEWFFEPYAKQIVNVTKAMHAENAIKPSDNVAKAQKFVQSQLQGADLLGFGGAVADIQKKLLDPTALPEMQSYLNAAVGHVTRTLEKQQLLDPRFLSNALIAALPAMDTPIDGMPDDIAPLATEKLLAKLFPGGQAELPIPEVAQAAVWKKLTEAIQGLFTDLTTADRRTLFMLDRLVPLATDDQNKIKTDLKLVGELRSRIIDGTLNSNDRKQVEKL